MHFYLERKYVLVCPHFNIFKRFGDEGSWRLLGFTLFGVFLLIVVKLYNAYETQINEWWESKSDSRNSKEIRRFRAFVRWYFFFCFSLKCKNIGQTFKRKTFSCFLTKVINLFTGNFLNIKKLDN